MIKRKASEALILMMLMVLGVVATYIPFAYAQGPTASFTMTPPSPNIVGAVITFNASASTPTPGSGIVAYLWFFGDGVIINVTLPLPNPNPVITHSYGATSWKNVTLTVFDSAGNKDSVSQWMQIIAPPVASFTYSPEEPQVCEMVLFNASGSTADGGTITSFKWDFDDGNVTDTGTTDYVWHHYATYGYYDVTLNVTDDQGLWDTDTKTIHVREHPIASFTMSPSPAMVCQTVTFNASASTPDGGQLIDPDSYFWDFGDGTNATGKIVTHHYMTKGWKTVTLNVTDDEGKWDDTSKPLRVDLKPVANFTWSPPEPQVCEMVLFDASATTPGWPGTITSFKWDFDDGNVTDTGTTDYVWHHYATYGYYDVTLNVTDDKGYQDTMTKTIHVREHPIASFTMSPSPAYIYQTVTFDASASTPEGGVIISYEWDFKDGNTASGKIVTHSYTTSGNYKVKLNVTDSEDKWDIVQQWITIMKTAIQVDPPSVEFWAPAVCTEFEIEIVIKGAPDLYGFEFLLKWNSTLINLVDIHPKLDQIWETYEIWTETGHYPNCTDWLWFAAVSLADGYTGGDPTKLVNLWFHIIYDPCYPYWNETAFDLQDVKLSDSEANPIPHDVHDGKYIIRSPKPKLELDPSTITVNRLCQTFTVTVEIINAVKLYDYGFTIKYNQTLIQVVEGGVVIEEEFLTPPYVAKQWSIDRQNGKITVYVEKDCNYPPANGNGTLVTITFHVINSVIWQKGKDNKLCDEIKFIDWKISVKCPDPRDIYPPDVDANNATYSFIPVPGDVDGDGDVDIVDLRLVAAHWCTAKPEYDLNADGHIDIFDVVLVAIHL